MEGHANTDPANTCCNRMVLILSNEHLAVFAQQGLALRGEIINIKIINIKIKNKGSISHLFLKQCLAVIHFACFGNKGTLASDAGLYVWSLMCG